ncbi:hypothetical protein SAMN05518866_1338 [Sphingobium sp. YR768]|nr:hypothetical protein SAMN05518866_1338 [Sphingobium sp. YR768]
MGIAEESALRVSVRTAEKSAQVRMAVIPSDYIETLLAKRLRIVPYATSHDERDARAMGVARTDGLFHGDNDRIMRVFTENPANQQSALFDPLRLEMVLDALADMGINDDPQAIPNLLPEKNRLGKTKPREKRIQWLDGKVRLLLGPTDHVLTSKPALHLGQLTLPLFPVGKASLAAQ